MPKSVNTSTSGRGLSQRGQRGRKSSHPYISEDPSTANVDRGHQSSQALPLLPVKTEVPSSQPQSTCLLCHQEMKMAQGVNDARHHYGLCFYNEGAFHKLYPPLDLVDGRVVDEVGKKYSCQHTETCTKRKMGYRELCMHMATTHMVVGTLMAMDDRVGMDSVLASLYPGVEYKGGKTEVRVKVEKGGNYKTADSTPLRRKRGPASRVKVEPRPASSPRIYSVSVPVRSTREDEDVDDPGAVSPPHNSKPPKVEPKAEDSPPLPTPRIDRVHNCLVCGGQGKANKEGRNLNMGDGMQDLKYHYAVCYYNEGAFMDLVDPGEENKTIGGEALELFGLRFKYKCPFVTCSRNTGRGAGKMMGYKEYSIHCGVAHHLLEKVMARDKREGLNEVRAAIILERKREGISWEEMPEVQVEEVQTCLLCNGETKEAKNLSFAGEKRLQLRYHYASCYYESGVYLAKYPPGEQNMDQEGQPRDVLGRDIKYSCEVTGCTIKRKMGYKEFCIHMSNEHRGLLDILREDGRPGLSNIADRLEEED
eukprot:GFUD01008004.1.p1 GENE.GFUD01008004.1~~GFUD01008004.1.p1  ORF type:complete len:555 (+),score=150.79 GFUD01008004.1:62-1666(+)